MRIRSRPRHKIAEPLHIEFPSQEDQFQEDPPEVLMADNRTMAQLLQFFPPLKTTNLRNEITRFQQRFDESFSEAWDHFNDLLRACPHHRFSELHQLDTFYNALNVNDQDSLNSAAVVDKVNMSYSTPAISFDVVELKDMVRALLLDKNQSSAPAPSPTPAPVKAVEPNCVTCGGTDSYQNCPATSGNVYQDNIQEYVSQAAAANYNQRNTSFQPQMVANQIRPPRFPPVQNNQNNFNRENTFNQNRGGSKYAKPVSKCAKPVGQFDGYGVQTLEFLYRFIFRVRDAPWFATAAKQARGLHSVKFDHLYAFLKHNERDAKELQEMRQRFSDALALLANTYNPPPSYIMVQNVQGRQSQGYASSTGKKSSYMCKGYQYSWRYRDKSTKGNQCYNCKSKGHISKQCTAKKKVKDFEWFKDKMLLTQAQESGVVLNAKQ
nr:hypothetical protein [Tanacetum cinerariifolium]